MSWKTKAKIQNLIAHLPERAGYSTYYWIQRHFGALKNGVDVAFEVRKSMLIVKEINDQDLSIHDKKVLEIGAGRTLNTEIGLWLCGCGEIIAVDLNPYLATDLVADSINWLKNNPDTVREILQPVSDDTELFNERLDMLFQIPDGLDALSGLINLTYMAPADARKLDIDSAAIDFHISTNVFEHVPGEDIRLIMEEARRVLKPDGLLVHRIDLSDHFAHADGSLSSLNFLQFSKHEWDRLAGNKFAYHNRLRASDFKKLLSECGIQFCNWQEDVDEAALRLLSADFPLHQDYLDYSHSDLATHFVTCTGTFTQDTGRDD